MGAAVGGAVLGSAAGVVRGWRRIGENRIEPLVVTSATLVVTGALLVVTMFAIRNNKINSKHCYY